MSEIKIFVSGDFCPKVRQKEILQNKSAPEKVFGKLYKSIQESEISITNLEGPLTELTNPIGKLGSNFRFSPHFSTLLKNTGFNILTLANNHIYDQGQQGLNQTFKALKNKNIDWVGAGKSLTEAQKPYYYSINGYKLAFINFAEVEFTCANENHGGANPMDLIDNIHQIQKAKKRADKVIVIIHGGHEYYHYPSPEMLKRYKFIAENGADVILSHHSHCIGGYEVYKGTPIFYDLGNFLFPPESKNPRKSWFEGYSVLLNVGEEKLNFEILPHEQCKNDKISVNLRSKDSKINWKIEKLSEKLKDKEFISYKWQEYVKTKKRFLGHMAGYNKYTSYILEKFGLMNYFINKNKLNYIKQFITCQAHNETAKELLKKYLGY